MNSISTAVQHRVQEVFHKLKNDNLTTLYCCSLLPIGVMHVSQIYHYACTYIFDANWIQCGFTLLPYRAISEANCLVRYKLKIFEANNSRWFLIWLIIYGFTSRSRCGNVTIAGEGLQNLGLCSALRASEQGGIFIVPHVLWHPLSSEGPPPFSCLFRHTKRCWESILTQILMGPIGHVWKGMLRPPILTQILKSEITY